MSESNTDPYKYRVDFGKLASRVYPQSVALYSVIGIFLFSLTIAVLASSSYLHQDNNFWSKIQDNHQLIMWTIIGCTVGILLVLIIFFAVWGAIFAPKLRVEDKFLTEMSVVATAPASVNAIKIQLKNYLNDRLGPNSFGDADMTNFGEMLSNRDGVEYVHQLKDNAMPGYIRKRLGKYGNSYRREYIKANRYNNQDYTVDEPTASKEPPPSEQQYSGPPEKQYSEPPEKQYSEPVYG